MTFEEWWKSDSIRGMCEPLPEVREAYAAALAVGRDLERQRCARVITESVYHPDDYVTAIQKIRGG
jgi:hypothetical protein